MWSSLRLTARSLFLVQVLLAISILLVPTSKAQAGDDEIVRFFFRFGFFQDDLTPVTEVIKEDVEAVICQTQYFFSQLVQNATGIKSIHAKATEIDWGYHKDQDLPAQLNFTIEFTDALDPADANIVDEQILITQMEELGQPGLQKFITSWVWMAEPKGLNFFANANRMAFDGIKQARVEGNMQEAECPETTAPTFAPTVSAAPTQVPRDDIIPPLLGGAGGPNASATTSPNGAGGAGAGDGADAGAGSGGADQEPTSNPAGAASGSSPNGKPVNGTRPNWPFGPNHSPANLKPMSDYSLLFTLFQDHERAPTLAEINSLLCQINDFFTSELRRELKNNTIHCKTVYIDYKFLEEGAGKGADIVVNFTAYAYYGDEQHTQLNANDVFQAMQVTNAELKNFVEGYVWKSEPKGENLFFHTQSLSMKAELDGPLETDAMLAEAVGCILPPSHGDSGSVTTPPGGGNGPAGSGVAVPGGSNLGLGGDAKSTRITTAFRVSNLEDIKTMQSVKAEGLDAAFPAFVNQVVEAMRARDSTRRLMTADGRRLRVVAVPGSATVNSVQEFTCPANALPDLTCHEALASYDVLMSSDEDENTVNNEYTDATNRAAVDGTFNSALQRTVPDTPLYIGIMTSKDQIPPGSQQEDDGWFKWWYLLILLLLLLLCCLICLYCSMLKKEKEHDRVKETTIQEREVLVEEFDDEDAPKDRDNDDDEVFEDDPDAGAMVPYAPSPSPAPYSGGVAAAPRQPVVETGVLVPVDDKAHQDQIERERILGRS